MSPPATPSPHQSLQLNISAPCGPQGKDSATARLAYDARQEISRQARPNYHIADKSIPTRRSSQFAAPPRFSSTHRTQPSQTLPSSSLSIRRDRVEDFDRPSKGDAPYPSYSPILNPAGSRTNHDRIEESLTEHEGNDLPASGTHDANHTTDRSISPARRRKLPLPALWQDHVKISDTLLSTEGSLANVEKPATTKITTPERSTRQPPIMISSAPSSRNRLVSPIEYSPVTPASSSAKRKAPRFDFGNNRDSTKRVLNASNGLQRITATHQFILPPVPVDDDDSDLTNTTTNLTLLFSPQKHKKYQYAPGGLAATVRDWVLGIAVEANGGSTQSKFRVLNIKPGQRGSQFVFGVDGFGEEQNYLLFGNAQNMSDAQLTIGASVILYEPCWYIELDDDLWIVGIRWELNTDDNS